MNQSQIKWRQVIRPTLWEGFGHCILYSLSIFFPSNAIFYWSYTYRSPYNYHTSSKNVKSSDNHSNNCSLKRHTSFTRHQRLPCATSRDIIQLRRNQLGQLALLSLDSFTSSCMLMPHRGEPSPRPVTSVKLMVPGTKAVDYDPPAQSGSST